MRATGNELTKKRENRIFRNEPAKEETPRGNRAAVPGIPFAVKQPGISKNGQLNQPAGLRPIRHKKIERDWKMDKKDFFRIKIECSLGIDPEEQLLKEYAISVVYPDTADDGKYRETTVGSGRAWLAKSMDLGSDTFIRCDAESGGLSEMLEDVFSDVVKMTPAAPLMDTEHDGGEFFYDILFIESLVLKEGFRGEGAGLDIVRACMTTLIEDHNTMVFLNPRPMQENRGYLDEYQGMLDGLPDPETGRDKLLSHFGKIGFKPVGKTGYLHFNMRRRPPCATRS